MNPTLYEAIKHSPIQYGEPGATVLRLVLPTAASAPTVVDFARMPGTWIARVPGGTSANSVQVKVQLSGATAPVAGDLNLPAAGTSAAAVAPIDSVPADKEFTVDVDFERILPRSPTALLTDPKPQWTQYAFQWNGGAAGELILRKVRSSSADR